MKIFITYILIRLLDLWSTKINLGLTDGDTGIEGNPISRMGMETLGINGFMVFNLLVSIALGLLIYHWRKRALVLFMVLNSAIVTMNLIIYFITWRILYV